MRFKGFEQRVEYPAAPKMVFPNTIGFMEQRFGLQGKKLKKNKGRPHPVQGFK